MGFLDNHKSYCLSIYIIRKMKWAIPFFLGTIWCLQLVGQAAIVRERLNGDDNIVNQDITKDTDKGKTSECKDGETTMMECNHCFCAGGSWMCTKKGCGNMPVAEGTDKGKTSVCKDEGTECESTSQCSWCQIGFFPDTHGCCRLGEDGVVRCHYVTCQACWVFEDHCEACRAKACRIL